MTTSSPSTAPSGRGHRKPRSRRRTVGILGGCLAVLVAVVAGIVVFATGGSNSAGAADLGKAIAAIPGSHAARILVQEGQLARNCREPKLSPAKHAPVNFVWPGQVPDQGGLATDAIESYAPASNSAGANGTVLTWTLNPLQQVKTKVYSLQVAAGQCSAALPMQVLRGPAFSLGNGRSKPTIVLKAVVPHGDKLQWAAITAVDHPLNGR